MAKAKGKVVISGEQPLFATIKIKKDVSIECIHDNNKAVLTNKGDLVFAFELYNKLSVTISCIDFNDISIIAIHEISNVTVISITFGRIDVRDWLITR